MSLPVARVEELEGILRQELQPDEEFRVVWRDGRPMVEPTTTAPQVLPPFSQESPDLHEVDEVYLPHPFPFETKADLPDELRGVLLTANQTINDKGMWVIFGGLIAIETFCVGIHMSWWDAIGPLAIGQLQGFWVYLLIHMIGLCVFAAMMAFPERRAYRRHRDLVHEAIDRAGLNRFEVIGKIQGDPDLGSVATCLKKDQADA